MAVADRQYHSGKVTSHRRLVLLQTQYVSEFIRCVLKVVHRPVVNVEVPCLLSFEIGQLRAGNF